MVLCQVKWLFSILQRKVLSAVASSGCSFYFRTSVNEMCGHISWACPSQLLRLWKWHTELNQGCRIGGVLWYITGGPGSGKPHKPWSKVGGLSLWGRWKPWAWLSLSLGSALISSEVAGSETWEQTSPGTLKTHKGILGLPEMCAEYRWLFHLLNLTDLGF